MSHTNLLSTDSVRERKIDADRRQEGEESESESQVKEKSLSYTRLDADSSSQTPYFILTEKLYP